MNAFAPRLNRNGTQIRAERTRVSVPASIVTMSAYQFPELADISRSGAKLSGTSLPPQGTTALLRAGKLEVLCRVMWVKEGQCGIRFEEAVSPAILKQLQLDGTMALEPLATVEPRDLGGEAGVLQSTERPVGPARTWAQVAVQSSTQEMRTDMALNPRWGDVDRVVAWSI